ncbi:MAG: extracellular solute-binding protein [Spirochaetales bacterium]|nr:extracellular solute-binding protein [Spirochaetales bacterium]
MKVNKFALTAVALLLVSGFTGCQKKNSTDLLGNKLTTGNLEPVTLTVYIYGWGSQYQAYLDRIADEIENRTRKTLNINLEFQMFIPYQYRGAIKDLSEGTGGADLYITGGDPEIISKSIETGTALDITGLFPKFAPEYYERLGELRDYYSRNGRIYAVPNNYIYKNSPCAVVREDLFKRYCNGPIRSLEDFEKFMENVHANEDHIITMSFDNSQSVLDLFANYYGYAILDSFLGLVYKWNDPEMKIMAWEDMPEFEEMVNRVYGWYRKGYVNRNYGYIQMWANYNETIWASWICNQLSVCNLNAVQYHRKTGYQYLEFRLFPDLPGQQIQYQIEGFIINANSPNPERALMFLEWLHQDQKNYDLIRYGFKGENYMLKGKQYYVHEQADVTHSFPSWVNQPFIDIDYERTHIANSPKYVEETIKSYKDPASRPPHFGFNLDTSALSIARRTSSRYEIEMALLRGDIDKMTIEHYREMMKKNGSEKLVTEAQRQLDKWREERE